MFFEPNTYNPKLQATAYYGLSFLAHERAHVEQYRQGMTWFTSFVFPPFRPGREKRAQQTQRNVATLLPANYRGCWK